MDRFSGKIHSFLGLILCRKSVLLLLFQTGEIYSAMSILKKTVYCGFCSTTFKCFSLEIQVVFFCLVKSGVENKIVEQDIQTLNFEEFCTRMLLKLVASQKQTSSKPGISTEKLVIYNDSLILSREIELRIWQQGIPISRFPKRNLNIAADNNLNHLNCLCSFLQGTTLIIFMWSLKDP